MRNIDMFNYYSNIGFFECEPPFNSFDICFNTYFDNCRNPKELGKNYQIYSSR